MTRKRWVLAGAAVLIGVSVTGRVVLLSGGQEAAPAPQDQAVNTVTVMKGTLSAMVALNGILTYRARSDGSPYVVVNQASGTYTELPDAGDQVRCGDGLYRVNDHPVLLLCGAVPAYRDVHQGDVGNDVRQLNQNLHTLGYDASVGIDPDDDDFTWETVRALEKLQRDKGVEVTGQLHLDDAVFLPSSVRVARVAGELGGAAQPAAQVLYATSDTLEVQADLDASQQGDVHPGDPARITLPGNTSVTGKVNRLGRVAQVPAGQNNAGQNNDPGDASIRAYISLDDPGKAGALDQAPAQVDVTTKGVASALSVPVTAIVGRSGGGFGVEVVRAGGRRELVAVELGLFDTTSGRVEVRAGLGEGEHVVVPSP